MICPKDMQPCCDDLCAGGGCLAMGGYEPLTICQHCHGLIDNEIPECSTCTCDDDCGDDDYPEDGELVETA